MPAASQVDPGLLAAAAGRVARARDDVHAAAEAVLDPLPDAGDRHTQELVDALVERAADALRALTEDLTETTRALQSAAVRYAEADRAAARALVPATPGRQGGHAAGGPASGAHPAAEPPT